MVWHFGPQFHKVYNSNNNNKRNIISTLPINRLTWILQDRIILQVKSRKPIVSYQHKNKESRTYTIKHH